MDSLPDELLRLILSQTADRIIYGKLSQVCVIWKMTLLLLFPSPRYNPQLERRIIIIPPWYDEPWNFMPVTIMNTAWAWNFLRILSGVGGLSYSN